MPPESTSGSSPDGFEAPRLTPAGVLGERIPDCSCPYCSEDERDLEPSEIARALNASIVLERVLFDDPYRTFKDEPEQ